MTKFSNISLYLTKLYVTLSFASASSVKYSEIRQNFSKSAECCDKPLEGGETSGHVYIFTPSSPPTLFILSLHTPHIVHHLVITGLRKLFTILESYILS